jgi:radical SAM superfamily enzyme YgiQ (UPF0313 family)
MRIAFIRPLAAINRHACNVPLAYIHLAAYLRACGHQGDILDMVLEGVTPAAVDDFIRRNGIRVAGIGCMTCELPEALAEARRLKQAHLGIMVVMGGAHPSAAPEDCLADGAADYVVAGEGEIALAQLLTALESGGDPASIPGVWAVRNGTVLRNAPAPAPDIEALPTPAYDLLDLEKYFRLDTPWHFPKSNRVVQMITSRGCPYRCSYCHTIHGKKYRGLDPEKVLNQIEWLARAQGVEEFLIVDDIFNFELERAKCICRGIVDRRLKVHLQFPNGLRGDRLDEELMALMAKAGTHFLSIAIETASERYQKLIRKNLQVEKAIEAAGWARRCGIEVCGFFMIGFPNETLEEAERTIRLALQAPFDSILISIATPFKGTELRDDVRNGRFGEMEPEALEALDRLFPVVPSKALPPDTLRRLQRHAYWRFYLRPRPMWNLAKRLTNRRNLRKLIRAIRARTIQDDVTAFN